MARRVTLKYVVTVPDGDDDDCIDDAETRVCSALIQDWTDDIERSVTVDLPTVTGKPE